MARKGRTTELEIDAFIQHAARNCENVRVNGVPVAEYQPAGGSADTGPPVKPKNPKPDVPMVAPLFVAPGTWVLPIPTASEINGRKWRERSKRTDIAWRIVSPAFGPRVDYYAHYQRFYHAGRPLRIVFTRLGGKKIDRANLGSALKATEDAVAFMLGANDGNENWQSEFEWEPGERHGVRIQFFIPGQQ